MLAHGAVHGAFAGFTGVTVGLVNTHYCYLPSEWAAAGFSAVAHWTRAGPSPTRLPSLPHSSAAPCPPPAPPTSAVPLIIQAPRKVDPNGELWNRLRSSIGQPNFGGHA